MMKKFFVLFFMYSATLLAQYVEEDGTLESIYETRARQALNTILRPNDYSIVVSAEINKDEKKLKEYNEQLELMNLPGMPFNGPVADIPGHNTLHELKSRVEVNLVLNSLVPVDKEKIIRTVLSSKLHLDESSGDVLNIQRAQFLKDDEQKTPPLLPEFSWRTWTLILILALLALAGLVFWVTRRKQKQEEEDLLNERTALPPENDRKKGQSDDNTVSDETAEKNEALEAKRINEEILLQQYREHIIAIATQYPNVISKSLQNCFNEGSQTEVVIFLEHLGWDISKTIFNPLSPRLWGKIGAMVKNKSYELTHELKYNAVSKVYKFILGSYIEHGGNQDQEKNPFDFLFKTNNEELKTIIKNEPPNNLALISLYLDVDQMESFFEMIPGPQHSLIALEVTKMNELPQKVIDTLAMKLRDKLNLLRKDPVVSSDGPHIAAKIIRSLSPDEEMRIMENMLKNSPEDSIKIRQSLLYFPDIIYLPIELVGPYLSDLETDTLRVAFEGWSHPTLFEIFNSLPKKKVMMVERDIKDKVNIPSKSQIAKTWRELSLEIEKRLKAKDMKLGDYIGKADALAARNRLAA